MDSYSIRDAIIKRYKKTIKIVVHQLNQFEKSQSKNGIDYSDEIEKFKKNLETLKNELKWIKK